MPCSYRRRRHVGRAAWPFRGAPHVFSDRVHLAGQPCLSVVSQHTYQFNSIQGSIKAMSE